MSVDTAEPPSKPRERRSAAPLTGRGAPDGRWIIPTHILAAALIQSNWISVQFILPVLARKQFDASNWQTVLVTAAPTVLSVLSIFWNAVLSGRRLPSYLAMYWLLMGLPLAAIGRAGTYWDLLIPHLISSIGSAAYHPVAGDLLRTLYPEQTRGRVYSWIWGSSMVIGAGAGYAMGELLKVEPLSYRFIMPAAAGMQLVGVVTLMALSHHTGHNAARNQRLARRARDANGSSGLGRLLDPILHMGGILKADPVFARYEAAFMTYGVGWMIVYALMPLVVTRQFQMDYDQIVEATYVPYWLAMTAMVVPAGMLMDRLGAARSTGLSFAMLALHPLGLIGAIASGEDAYWVLMGVSAYYGVAHAGANVGWMLGPVSLAPSPEKVSHYVAIHATMVGIRGTIFQVLGVWLYELSGGFTFPLLVAGAAYAWSAWQMWSIRHRRGMGRAAP